MDCLYLVAQTVKRLSTMLETQVRALGWEDPLEKEMAIHSSILPRKFHGWRSLGLLYCRQILYLLSYQESPQEE